MFNLIKKFFLAIIIAIVFITLVSKGYISINEVKVKESINILSKKAKVALTEQAKKSTNTIIAQTKKAADYVSAQAKVELSRQTE